MARTQPRREAKPRWWEARRAQNRKPSTYTCPLCGELMPALSDHMLLYPEGDHARRRHAHTACVMRARERGELPTRDEWLATQPGQEPQTGLWRLLRRRVRPR